MKRLIWLAIVLPLSGCLLSGCASARTDGNYRVKSGTIGTQFVIDVQTGGFKIGLGFPGHIDIEGEGKYAAGAAGKAEGTNGENAPSFNAFGSDPVLSGGD